MTHSLLRVNVRVEPAEKFRSSEAVESEMVPEKRTEQSGGKSPAAVKFKPGTRVSLAPDCGENATEGHVCATSWAPAELRAAAESSTHRARGIS